MSDQKENSEIIDLKSWENSCEKIREAMKALKEIDKKTIKFQFME